MLDWIFVTAAAALAGLLDAVVGGGGLVLVPALFATYPSTVPSTLLGTNKAASMWGTAWAVRQYAQRVTMRWQTLLPGAAASLAGSFAGAWVVTQVSPDGLRRALPLVMVAVLLYTLARKDLGRTHAPRWSASQERLWAVAIGGGIGFYDGFFGPGTGSFLIFLLVRVLGYDFLHASAGAKLLNLASNVAAVALFAAKGHVWWHLGLTMAVANVLGSFVGSRLALRHGAGFVRGVFLLVVSLLIVRTGYDAWLR